MPDMNIELPADASLLDAMSAAAVSVLRVNAARKGMLRPVLIPKRVTIALEECVVTPEQERLLALAGLTGYKDGPPFRAPDEVRMFFHPGAVEAAGGKAEGDLAAMAEAVIATRTHCEF